MGNFFKKIIVKFNSSRLLTEGPTKVNYFLAKFIKNPDLKVQDRKEFIENIKD